MNKLERLKAQKLPIDFDLDSIDFTELSEEDRFYLKNYGIYNIKLRPEEFMFRLRIIGGRVDRAKITALVQYAKQQKFKLLITARAQIEVHGIKPSQILNAYQNINEMGIEMRQTLTDNFRAIVTDPYDGISDDSHIECQPIIDSIHEEILGTGHWMGTIPRKFNTALIGRVEPVSNQWGSDLLFALAFHNGRYGFNVYLGGKNNQTARDVDIFVLPDRAKDLFMAVAKVYNEYGSRSSRSKNRFYFLIEELGIDAIRELIATQYGALLESSGKLMMKSASHVKYTQLQGGRTGIAIDSNKGEMDLDNLETLVSGLKEDEELRLGTDQNYHLLTKSTFKPKGSMMSSVILCAGVRYCPLSLWDIKRDRDILPIDKLTELDVSIGFSGCLKGCGRHLHSDIGLVGLRTNLYAETERALRLYIGATQGVDARPGRLLYYSVPERKFGEVMNVILDEYENSRHETFEKFSREVLYRYDEEFLQLWFLSKLSGNLDGLLESCDTQEHAHMMLVSKQIIDSDMSISDLTRELSHKVWDI